MHETDTEITALQNLLDDSYRNAGDHLLTIHTTERRLSGPGMSELLTGVCILNLATINSDNRPVVAPVDGLFLGGLFWFGSSQNSLRFKHIRRNPHVSAAYTQGEEVSILVHGIAHEIDTASGQFERLHDYCREIYGAKYDSWNYWGKEPFAWIEPRRLYALKMESQQ